MLKIYFRAGDRHPSQTVNSSLYRGLFKFIIFKYNIKCFCWGNTIKALGEKNKGGGVGDQGAGDNITMNLFLEEQGNILHTLGLKVHKCMGSLSTAKHKAMYATWVKIRCTNTMLVQKCDCDK